MLGLFLSLFVFHSSLCLFQPLYFLPYLLEHQRKAKSPDPCLVLLLQECLDSFLPFPLPRELKKDDFIKYHEKILLRNGFKTHWTDEINLKSDMLMILNSELETRYVSPLIENTCYTFLCKGISHLLLDLLLCTLFPVILNSIFWIAFS